MPDSIPVAIIAFAQLPCVANEQMREEDEMINEVIREVFAATNLSTADMGFICSGSCDYMRGLPFSFVSALDAVGAWPPVNESHVEMDGAFALYEAYIHLQLGDVDTALVYACSKSSQAPLRQVMGLQMDPYYGAPLGIDSVALAALQARQLLDADRCTERDWAELAQRRRAGAARNPAAQIVKTIDVDSLMAEDYIVSPLRKHACPPIGDCAAAMLLACGSRARALSDCPVWIKALDHRMDIHYLGMRDLCVCSSAALAAQQVGIADAKIDLAELHAPYAPQELILRDAFGLDEHIDINPSGGALTANPMMVAGLIRFGEAAQRIQRGEARCALAHATSGPCLQHNLVGLLEKEDG